MTTLVTFEPRWLTIARSYLGTQEVVGKGSNAKILAMTKHFARWIKSFFKDDDTPWCALFVGHCLGDAGLEHTNSLAARSYETYGVPCEPALGAIMVFARKGGGHVGFYTGETATAYRILGGNQSNAVNETWIAKNRHTATRWPAGEPLPTTGRITLASNGQPLSTNEA
jgi:uncharacterized protein (TIGR02594 family)